MAGGASLSFDSVGLISTEGTPGYIGDLVIGNTLADVLPVSLSETPEPSAYALMVIGILGFGACRTLARSKRISVIRNPKRVILQARDTVRALGGFVFGSSVARRATVRRRACAGYLVLLVAARVSAWTFASTIHGLTAAATGPTATTRKLTVARRCIGCLDIEDRFVGFPVEVDHHFSPPLMKSHHNRFFSLGFLLGSISLGLLSLVPSQAGSLSYPAPLFFLAAAQISQVKDATGPDWFPLDPTLSGPSVFGMENWLDAPAGKHGGVRMVHDQFKFEDGSPVQFWGTNLAFADSSPEKAKADLMVKRFARYGVNSVRLHKFTGAGWAGFGDPNDATQFEPKGLDRFDYFTSQLAAHGIYFGWSHTFQFLVRPGNKAQLLAYDEIARNLDSDTYGLINCAEDVQDLMIQSVVNLLKHENPYTHQAYADDPALAYIELQNEDDIFWYTTMGKLQKCPTYLKKFTESYCDWLKKRYGSQDKLAAAWGDALKAGETLDAQNIQVDPNPWDFSDEHPSQGTGRRPGACLLDCALFLHQSKDQFYSKFVKAIRDAGYKGPLVGSPWQAPAMLPAYYNLLSDFEVGYIDRHDYFGGQGHVDDTMLSHPGSGYLSAGLQQVTDRPFGLSEWITQYPTLYSAEGPAIVAAYGLGLQDWSASYEFSSLASQNIFVPAMTSDFSWYVDVVNQMGIYPALARMVYRRDVHPEPRSSPFAMFPLPELQQGTFSFSDEVNLQGDLKTFGGSVPPEVPGRCRCSSFQFTDTAHPSIFPDMSKYQKGSVITSSTGQLVWDYSDKGFFTINTDGTKGLVGFAQDKPAKLGDITITSHSPYAVILVTALDQGKTLATTDATLITARRPRGEYRFQRDEWIGHQPGPCSGSG